VHPGRVQSTRSPVRLRAQRLLSPFGPVLATVVGNVTVDQMLLEPGWPELVAAVSFARSTLVQ
jgi:hypothetical protein